MIGLRAPTVALIEISTRRFSRATVLAGLAALGLLAEKGIEYERRWVDLGEPSFGVAVLNDGRAVSAGQMSQTVRVATVQYMQRRIKTFEEFAAITKGDHPLNAAYRQVSTYWEMAYGMVRHGVLHPDFMIECNGAEGLFVLGPTGTILFCNAGAAAARARAESAFLATDAKVRDVRGQAIDYL